VLGNLADSIALTSMAAPAWASGTLQSIPMRVPTTCSQALPRPWTEVALNAAVPTLLDKVIKVLHCHVTDTEGVDVPVKVVH
jgi:hypothetical protein